jgi:hypothetical protein
LGVNWTGSKRVYKVAAAPTSYRRAHSRSRIFSSKKTLLLTCGLLFSLDRCLLMGDPTASFPISLSPHLPIFVLIDWANFFMDATGFY